MLVDLIDAEQPRFFHVHVQKTGGTALLLQLRQLLGANATYPNPTDGDLVKDTPQFSPDRLRARWSERRAEIRLISGHFPLCTVDVLDADFTTLAVLRDPVERTLSFLRNFRERRADVRHASLEEIYADDFLFRCLIQNHMVKMFSLGPADLSTGMFTRVEFSREHLERATENLATVDVIGLQERFPEFCHELERRFALHTDESVHANRTRPVEVSTQFRDRIAEDNALDIELYEFARTLVDTRAGVFV